MVRMTHQRGSMRGAIIWFPHFCARMRPGYRCAQFALLLINALATATAIQIASSFSITTEASTATSRLTCRPSSSMPARRSTRLSGKINKSTIDELKGPKPEAGSSGLQSEPSPAPKRRSSRGKRSEPDDLDKALENVFKIQKSRERIDIAAIQELKRKFKQTCDNTKRETQKLEQARALKKPSGTTRSGNKRGVIKEAVYSDGKVINRGIDDSQSKYDQAELDYLKKSIGKFKEVRDLKTEYLKYLVVDVFLPELKDIKKGKVKSTFHDRYQALSGKSRTDLLSEVWTSLFTNEQRDYINGLLQGAFETTSKDSSGDIKHSDINYVGIVIYGEVTIRIVKFVHKFKTNEEAVEFMIKSAREAYGFDDEDEDD